MSNTGDIINLVRDVLKTIDPLDLDIPIYKYGYPVEVEGTERFEINLIPNSQVRAGSMRQNNDLINLNFYVPKISGRPNSNRIETIDGLVQNAFDSYNVDTSRVGYYYLNQGTASIINESDKENLINIRIEATYT